MPLLALPNEVIAEIVGFGTINHPPLPDLVLDTRPRNHIDIRTLASLCLVSKRLYAHASARLYSHVVTDDFASSALLDTLGDPRIAGLVRTLSVYDYRPIAWDQHIQDDWTEKELEGWAKLERAIVHMANIERLEYVPYATGPTTKSLSGGAVPLPSCNRGHDGGAGGDTALTHIEEDMLTLAVIKVRGQRHSPARHVGRHLPGQRARHLRGHPRHVKAATPQNQQRRRPSPRAHAGTHILDVYWIDNELIQVTSLTALLTASKATLKSLTLPRGGQQAQPAAPRRHTHGATAETETGAAHTRYPGAHTAHCGSAQ